MRSAGLDGGIRDSIPRIERYVLVTADHQRLRDKRALAFTRSNNMTSPPIVLTKEQRSTIFEEGRKAAVAGRDLYANPYFGDESDERLLRWLEGYRSVMG